MNDFLTSPDTPAAAGDAPFSRREAAEALRAWFLGPHAENGQLLEQLIVETLRDHVFWRRNFHPEDGFLIREADKRRPGYDHAVSTLTQELMGLLSELKRGVPFFSGRYKGHMVFEQTIAAQIGYFAAMLYNPNNVSIEASPMTTRLELEVAAQLARMIGYDPERVWGHLTSGGTIANFEAMWIARSVLYFPVAAAAAMRDLALELDVALPSGERAPLRTLGLWELLNLRNDAVLELWGTLGRAAPHDEVRRALQAHALEALGYQEYARRLATRFSDTLPPSVVLVAATAHYSWEKIVRVLGIGTNRLLRIPVDPCYRLDPDALWQRLRELAASRTPVMACISVCGTTEESAVDQLDEVLAVRERAERELGTTFHLHSDACYGGYAAAVTWRADGTRRTAAEIREATASGWPSDGWLRAMTALGETDSITIDPHKLGYVPYPAGAFLARDRRTRELIAMEPPYLMPSVELEHADDLFLGRFIMEGSKPGASAAAVWLSHKVLPLDERGYGYLIERTVAGAHRLHAALRSSTVLTPFRAVVAPEPDLNIICYIMHHPALRTLTEVNAFNEQIYAHMSQESPGATPEYIITRTRFQSPTYDGAIDSLLAELGVCTPEAWRASANEGLVVLRSTVMDPFLAPPSLGGAPVDYLDHVAGFVTALRRSCEGALHRVGRGVDETDGKPHGAC
jgi:glutamate/tyrosine decarboxylase-like PLP-dependent enzyme